MENFQSCFCMILASIAVTSFILILCIGQKKKDGVKGVNKENAGSKRAAAMPKAAVPNSKNPKIEQSVKQVRDETMVTEDPDLVSRDCYEIKTKEEKEELEKLKPATP